MKPIQKAFEYYVEMGRQMEEEKLEKQIKNKFTPDYERKLDIEISRKLSREFDIRLTAEIQKNLQMIENVNLVVIYETIIVEITVVKFQVTEK